jgi:hypothetical protein
MPAGNCPICNSPSSFETFSGDRGDVLYEVGCHRCGNYRITAFTKEYIERALQLERLIPLSQVSQYVV